MAEEKTTDRELLTLWAKWWNGPGRENYTGNIIPPITKTGEQLYCIICAGGNDLPPGEECKSCGRIGE